MPATPSAGVAGISMDTATAYEIAAAHRQGPGATLPWRMKAGDSGYTAPMPLFEFTCKGCQQTFEELVTPDETVTCPHCGREELERLVSTFAVNHTQTEPPPPPCGRCGDPRGAGACSMN